MHERVSMILKENKVRKLSNEEFYKVGKESREFIHSLQRFLSFIHSFITEISIAPLQGRVTTPERSRPLHG